MVGLALVVFAVAGVAVDGTRAFLFRRTLQNVADSSALAAAGDIDQAKYYQSGGRELQLDPGAAASTARRWLTRRGIRLRIAIRSDVNRIYVFAKGSIAPSFLSLIGIHSIPVSVEASARPVPGAAPQS